jgi:hypothetical protein
VTDTADDAFENFAQEWARSNAKQIFETATHEERTRMVGFIMRPHVSDEVAVATGCDKCVSAKVEN